jgi:acetolactate synthase-1/2/3 large subunit
MKLADYVIQFVADQGVRHIFLLPGGGCMHLIDAIGRCRDLEFVCNLHEQACAIAADAYGQYTNNLGVALVTTGPGGTNTLTGVAAAWLDSTPTLFISGQVKRADLKGDRGVRQMGFQEIDIVAMVQSITKYAVTVTEPSTIRYHLERAVYLARNGRPGPVWLDIPLDVQAAAIEPEALEPFQLPKGPSDEERATLKRQVSRTIDLLNESERPIILAGNGVRLAKAMGEFSQLIELLQIPVLTTWKALDFLPDDHPLFAGRPGAVASRGANFSQQNSDWLLSLGARLDFGQTAYTHQYFARAARKIVVDIDGAEIRKLDMNVDVPTIADAGDFVREFLSQRNRIRRLDRSGWLKRCKDWQVKYPIVLPEYWNEPDRINNYVLIEALSEAMSGDDLLVPGSSGACSEITMQAFRPKQGARVFNSEGLGPMGFGIAAPLGACLASGRKRTVSIDGDGGFVMNLQELAVVKRLDLPIKFFVLNNGGYVSIQATQRNYFDGRFVASGEDSGLFLPNISKVCAAFGFQVFKISTSKDIIRQVRDVLQTDGPALCEVDITATQSTAPRVSNKQLPNGSMVSMPMEDLWPLLDRAEFRENMLIPPIAH